MLLGGRYSPAQLTGGGTPDGFGMDCHRIGGWLLSVWQHAKPICLYIV